MATSTLPETQATAPGSSSSLTGVDEAGFGFSLLDIRRRITVEEYHRIVDAGILGTDPRVELLEGVIVNKMGKNPPHNLTCDLIQYILIRLLVPGYFVSMGTSMTIENRDGEPEPDAMILRGEPRDYAGRHRTPSDSPLAIEISDTSYKTDRSLKWALYAAARVPIYWVVDVNRRRLEVHTEPKGEGESGFYAQSRIIVANEEVPLVLDGREIARFTLNEILP